IGLAEAGLPPSSLRMQPNNIEVEQALIGAILVNNEIYHRVSEFLRAEHFYEPVHARIYAACVTRIAGGNLADERTLFHLFDTDPTLKELDGAQYLFKMARAAETIINAEQYARAVHDLALRRELIHVGEDVVNRAYSPATEDTGPQQIEHAEQELFRLAEQGDVKGGFRRFPDVLESTVDLVQSAYRKAGQVTGIPTGLSGVDEKLGGLQNSDLIILAGRPSMGKTALAVTMAANAAALAAAEQTEGDKHQNNVVGVFSLEMSSEQLAMRLLSAEAQIASDELRRGQLQDDDFHKIVRASQELAGRPLFIDDTPALSIAALRTRARRLKRIENVSLIVVDYLQLLRGSVNNIANRVQEIGEITQGLKAIAKELNVPVLALSQLSRAVESREDKRPLLSDLRDSGSIEQDADVVMFVYRDDYYQERSEPKQRPDEKTDRFQERYQAWVTRFQESKNKADVIIAKQRNGPIGTVKLQFDPSYGRFRNPEYVEYG
ncbi:MAG: replicative DNA helicase, partial [Pseudomonadota bacterium]